MRNDRGMAEIKQSVSSKYRSKFELTGGNRQWLNKDKAKP